MIEHLKSRDASIPLSAPDTPYTSGLEVGGKPVRLAVFQAGAGHHPYGYVFAWEEASTHDELDSIALSHASTAVALQLAKQQAVMEASNRHFNDFLAEMLEGKFVDEDTLYHRAQNVGLDLARKHMVMIADIECLDIERTPNQDQSRRLQGRLLSAVRLALEPLHTKSLVFPRGLSLVVFVHFERLPDRPHANKQARLLATALKDALEKEFRATGISVGIGDFYVSPLELAASYEEAQYALKISAKIYGSGNITAIHDVGIYKVLGQASPSFLNNYARNVLEQLVQYDLLHQSDLVNTVEVYLDEKENFTEVAKRLYVHPNTVKYRIAKVREVLGSDPFADPEQRLNLHLALKARLLLN